MLNDQYRLLAQRYDALNPKEEIFKQQPFFERLVSQYGIKNCLDCACGTGWHLFMLHGLGLSCSGSDISPEMIALAQENLKGKSIPLKQEDFRTLAHSWADGFDMVICMTTSLPHMLTDEDTETALNSIYDRLSPGGILVVSNGITDSLLDAKPKFMPARIHPDQAFYFFLEYPTPQRVVFNILHVRKSDSGFEHSFEVMEYNAMRQSTLERCFARTPFRRIEYFGDFDFSGYSPSASKLITIAQK